MSAGGDRLGFEEVLAGRERCGSFACSVLGECEGEIEEKRERSVVCGRGRRASESLTFSGLFSRKHGCAEGE